jgi:hypothetical protein
MIKRMVMLLSLATVGLMSCEETVTPTRSAAAPPAGAKFLEPEITPDEVAASVWSAKGDSAMKSAAAQWANIWIPEPGWFGNVERVEESDTGTKVWFQYSAPALFGGSYWVAAEFPGEVGKFRPAMGVTFTGRIEQVEALKPNTLNIRIIVRDAKVVTGGK